MDLHGRFVAIDIEATGNNDKSGVIVEIAAIEIIDGIIGKIYHTFVNPENKIAKEAFNLHGLTAEFLKDKPKFSEIIDSFLNFVGDSKIVAHDASQDIKFLNKELRALKRDQLSMNNAWCTQRISKYCLKLNFALSLNALCDNLNVDRSSRTSHRATIDAMLCAQCLIAMSKIDFPVNIDFTKNPTKEKPKVKCKTIMLTHDIKIFSKFEKNIIIPEYPIDTHRCMIKEFEDYATIVICKKQGITKPNNPLGYPSILKITPKKIVVIWFEVKTEVYIDPPTEYISIYESLI